MRARALARATHRRLTDAHTDSDTIVLTAQRAQVRRTSLISARVYLSTRLPHVRALALAQDFMFVPCTTRFVPYVDCPTLLGWARRRYSPALPVVTPKKMRSSIYASTQPGCARVYRVLTAPLPGGGPRRLTPSPSLAERQKHALPFFLREHPSPQ